eukprot:5203572-Ditylum_brightwellii.AAC.1
MSEHSNSIAKILFENNIDSADTISYLPEKLSTKRSTVESSVSDLSIWVSSMLSIVWDGNVQVMPCKSIDVALPHPAEVNYPMGLTFSQSKNGKKILLSFLMAAVVVFMHLIVQ